jgi:WD40 repeat protein
MTQHSDYQNIRTLSVSGKPTYEGWLSFTDDDKYLLVSSSCEPGWLQIWDVDTGILSYEYDQHFMLRVVPGAVAGTVVAFCPNTLIEFRRSGTSWTAEQMPHNLKWPRYEYLPGYWLKSMFVDENVVAITTNKLFTIMSRLTQEILHQFQIFPDDADVFMPYTQIYQAKHKIYVSTLYTKLLPGSASQHLYHYATYDRAGRVCDELHLYGNILDSLNWIEGTRTSIIKLQDSQFAAVFRDSVGKYQLRLLKDSQKMKWFTASESGRTVIGLAPDRVTRWHDGTPTTVPVLTEDAFFPCRPSYNGDRCVLMSPPSESSPPYGIAIDFDSGRVLGRCPGQTGGVISPYAFSRSGRLFATLVAGSSDSGYGDQCKDGTVVITHLQK